MLSERERLYTYGVKKDIEVYGLISLVCSIFGNGSNNNADLNIEKCMRVESHLGDYPDDRPEHGEGLSQFDEPTFKDTVNRTRTRDKQIAIERLGIDIDKAKYSDLRVNALLSALMTRLKYKLVPEAFPKNDLDQYYYYKKNWNSYADNAAGNYNHWVKMTQECYFDK